MADTFLDGDRRRLILVPGNHDVCWNTAFEAMDEIAIGPAKQRIWGQLSQPDSPYRWDWSSLKLYRVQDEPRYKRRTIAYWDFVQRFYTGATLLHPINPTRGYQLFELDDGRIVVAAFDSVHRNDCYSYVGALTPGAAGGSFLKIRELKRSPRLKVAVWHHSVQGPPTSADYMDVNEVHELAGHGFQLGLHGHQHIAAQSAYYVHRAEAQKIAVISAGSLCAGSRELPRGVNRQYNLMVINDDYRSARLHVREMVEGNHFAAKRSGAYVEGYVSIDWQPPLDLAGRPVDADAGDERRAVDLAEASFDRNDPAAALNILLTLKLKPGSYARQLAMRAAVEASDSEAIVRIAGIPTTSAEAVHLITALERLGRFAEAKTALQTSQEIDAATRDAIADRLDIKIRMRGE